MVTAAIQSVVTAAPAISVDRAEALEEIRRARANHGCDRPVFVGINNHGLHSNGFRAAEQPLLRVFNESDWQCELKIYHKADLRVKGIEPFKGEITQVVNIAELGDEPLEIRYYGLEPKEDGIWGHGPGVLDPRAHLVPELLTGTEIAWPFVYVYAEIKTVAAARADDYGDANAKLLQTTPTYPAARVLAKGLLRGWNTMDDSTEEVEERSASITASRPPSSPTPLRRSLPIVDIADVKPTWAAPGAAAGTGRDSDGKACAFPVMADHWDTGSPDHMIQPPSIIDAKNSERLQIDAKQAAASGDHKTAYLLMEKAIALVCSTDRVSVETAHEMQYAPMCEEAPNPPSGPCDNPKSFKPAVSYKLANGEVHVIPAGLYTEDEFFARSLSAQDLVKKHDAAVSAEEVGLNRANMSKYANPLTRTDSQCDSMQMAESLRTTIKHQAERARDVMEASRSKKSSPVMPAADPPSLPSSSELVDLGASMKSVSITVVDKESQMKKWDDAGSKLANEAASIWGSGAQ